MHVLTLYTKFTFGDRVQFDSKVQNRRGRGKVVAITIDTERKIDYIIAIPDGEFEEWQPGIYEDELWLDDGP